MIASLPGLLIIDPIKVSDAHEDYQHADIDKPNVALRVGSLARHTIWFILLAPRVEKPRFPPEFFIPRSPA